MDEELLERIRRIYLAAKKLAGEERDRYVRQSCEGADLRELVERWLKHGPPEGLSDGSHPEHARPAELAAGARLGHYEIQRRVGSGGSGRVYRAMDSTLRRAVAIKTLNNPVTASERSRRRFLREAESASGLNHPHIVTVYEVGSQGGIDYIAMEYIDGKSLRERIGKHGLDLEHFYTWAIQIADALAAAHAAGIVHRDLKPGNIMINERGSVKVVDFGLAKARWAGPSGNPAIEETLTAEGTVMGTSAYMAPEQAEGKPVDARADVFSFGCVLYEMLTGHRAFYGGSSISTIGAVLHKEPPPLREHLPDAPAGLQSLLARCLKKDPAERWQHMGDVRWVLEQCRAEGEAAQATGGRTTWRAGWRWAAATVAGALLLLAGAWYRGWNEESPPPARITALTTDAGLSDSPSLTADGSLMAFASDRGGEGNMDIWLQQIGGGSLIRITRDPADETTPDISADGTRIVFRSEKDGGGIYAAPALGGDPVLIAQGGRNPRFSPDGQRIAYWVGRGGGNLVAGSARAYVVPVGGGEPQPLAADLAAAAHPVWSPAGDAVLVVGRRNPGLAAERRPDWWVSPASGGPSKASGALAEAIKSTSAPLWESFLAPLSWGRDGGVLFAGRRGDVVNLWKVVVDPASGRAKGPAIQVTTGTSSDTAADVARLAGGGERLAFASQSFNFDLWAIPVDLERGLQKGELRRLTEDTSFEVCPSLPRDASRLFYSTRRQAGYSLCVRDLATGRETTLLTGGLEVRNPRVSGDGRWVTFAIQGDVSRVQARGGAVTALCKGCGTPTDSSFDGQSILLEPVESPEDIRMLDVGTGKVTTLAAAAGALYDGQLSSDGKWAVFHELDGDSPNSTIFVARVEGGKAVDRAHWIALTKPDAANRIPAWSPGGNVVYFVSDRDGFRCLWAGKLDPATKRPVGEVFAVHHFHHIRRSTQKHRDLTARIGLAVARDMVVLSLGDLTGNIWMLEGAAR